MMNFPEWGRSFIRSDQANGGGHLGQFVLGLVFIVVGLAGVAGGNSAAWVLVGVGAFVAIFPLVRFVRRRFKR
jgi:hypothetical protein